MKQAGCMLSQILDLSRSALSLRFSTLLSLLLLSASLTAQSITFDVLTTEDGLPDGTIMCMLKDRQGFLWIGTYGGIARYDGYSFKVFLDYPNDPQGLQGRLIYTMIEDKDGFLWFGSIGKGLNRYDPRSESFVHFRHDPKNSKSLGHDAVYALCEDHSGNLWVGTRSGLDRLDRRTGEFSHVHPNPKDTVNHLSNQITAIFEDPSAPGILWLGSWGDGMIRYDVGRGSFDHFRSDSSSRRALSNNYIWFVQKLSFLPSVLWIGTDAGGLNAFDIERRTFTSYKNDLRRKNSLGGRGARTLLEDRAGNVWVGVPNGGLALFDVATGNFVHFIHEPRHSKTISNNSVIALFEDETGLLFAGTREGLNRFIGPKEQFQLYQYDPKEPNSLTSNFLYSLYEDRQRILWIASVNGLNRFDPGKETFTAYQHNPNDPSTLRNNSVHTIYEDRQGDLWVGNINGFLHKFDRKTGKSKWMALVSDPHLARERTVHAIAEQRNGTLWAGTNEGLFLIDREHWNSRLVKLGVIGEDPSGADKINVIYEDKNGVLWIGTEHHGTIRLNTQSGAIKEFTHTSDDTSSIRYNSVTYIFEDKDGTLWATTGMGTLDRFDRETERFTTYFHPEDGTPNKIYGALEDNSGNFWMGTDNGLYRFNPNTRIVRKFSIRHGLQGVGFNSGSFCKSKSGMMYFGGSNGFNAFYPDWIKDNTHIPPVVVTRFKVFEQELEVEKAVPYLDAVEVSYDQNFLSFEFAALDFKDPTENRYAYMLSGIDEDWIYSSSRRYASYPNLAPGTYTFKVKASNNDGLWNEQGAAMVVTITPAWWQTWWFRSSSILVSLLLFVSVYRREVSRHRRDKLVQQTFTRQQIESQEAERKRLAAELHDGLGQNLLLASNELQQYLQDGNGTREGLGVAANLLHESIRSVREMASNLHPHQLDRLGFCAAVMAMADMMSHATGIAVKHHCDVIAGLLPKEAEVQVYRIVQEALSNIVHHACAREVNIEIWKGSARVEVVVTDDGKGFNVDDIGNHVATQQVDGSIRGFGLSSMAQRARIIGGEVKIDSTPGKGTVVSVVVPLERKHPWKTRHES